MSRGLGRRQRELLDILSEKEAPVSSGTLMWEHAIRFGDSTIAGGGCVSKSEYKAFRRRLHAPTMCGLLQTVIRPLSSLVEVSEVYPDSTTDGRTRRLRHLILPLLASRLELHAGHFGSLSREDHWFHQNPPDLRHVERWNQLEQRLVCAIACQEPELQTWILHTIGRGRAVFSRKGKLLSGLSLSELIEDEAASSTLSELHRELRTLADAVLPPAELKRMNWKDQLAHVFEFGARNRPTRLSKEGEALLEGLCIPHRDVVGWPRSATPRRRSWLEIDLDGRIAETAAPAELQTLVERDVLRRSFEFIALA